jgi:hypothetical protein
MRRRQALLAREELRRTLNTEQAVAEPPVSTEDPEPAPEKRKRGRPRKVKDDDVS